MVAVLKFKCVSTSLSVYCGCASIVIVFVAGSEVILIAPDGPASKLRVSVALLATISSEVPAAILMVWKLAPPKLVQAVPL